MVARDTYSRLPSRVSVKSVIVSGSPLSIPVLVISSDPSFLLRIKIIVRTAHDMVLIGQENKKNGHDSMTDGSPIVAIVDATQSMEVAIECLSSLASHYPDKFKYLFLAGQCEDEIAARAVQAGMDGFLWLHDLNQRTLLLCIREVFAGELVLPRRMVASLLLIARQGGLKKPNSDQSAQLLARTGLSPREIEVLKLVAQGARNKEIAETLVVSPSTVNNHIQSILNKLGVHNRVAALRVFNEATGKGF